MQRKVGESELFLNQPHNIDLLEYNSMGDFNFFHVYELGSHTLFIYLVLSPHCLTGLRDWLEVTGIGWNRISVKPHPK